MEVCTEVCTEVCEALPVTTRKWEIGSNDKVSWDEPIVKFDIIL